MKNIKTNHNRITDHDLKSALEVVRSDMLDNFPPPTEIPKHEFPADFYEKLKSGTKRRTFYMRMIKTAVAMLICLAVTSGIVLAISPEVRADVIRWLRSETSNSVDYRFGGDVECNKLPEITFGWLPGEYKIEKFGTFPTKLYTLTPLNSQAKTIYFELDYMTDGSITSLLNEGIAPSKVEIRGDLGEYYSDPDPERNNVLIWHDTRFNVLFSLSSLYNQETLLKIVREIQFDYQK